MTDAPGAEIATQTGPASRFARAEMLSDELECITACELAKRLDVNPKTIYESAARGLIPCRRLGRRVIFHLPSIVAWLRQSSTASALPGYCAGR